MQKKKNLKALARVDGNISSSVVNLSDLNVEKMEINVKKHNLKDQFKEMTERMIQQNNMEIISQKIKNWKNKSKKLPLLSKAINENDNS